MEEPDAENVTIDCVTTNVKSEGDNSSNHSDVVGRNPESDYEANNSVKDADHDDQKDDIYDHPLFELMCLLFEKCERATLTADCPSAESFDRDINKFIQSSEIFLSNNIDLDVLLVKAVQVLRIHLLELEKVSELCKDFCTRYIGCLKAKLQSENLLRVEGCDLDFDVDMTSPVSSPPLPATESQVMLQSPPLSGQGQIISGSTMYQMVQTAQGIVAQPIQIQAAPVQTTTPNFVSAAVTPIKSVSYEDHPRNGKRGVLPKSATQIMKSWLFQNIVHPYPTEDQKRQLAVQTNLTLLQVNNWFINARRRILQPMLDGSPAVDKLKKPRLSTKQNHRHWPVEASIADTTKYEYVENEGPVEMTIGCDDDGQSDDVLVEHTQTILTSTDLTTSIATLIVPTPPRTFTTAKNDT